MRCKLILIFLITGAKRDLLSIKFSISHTCKTETTYVGLTSSLYHRLHYSTICLYGLCGITIGIKYNNTARNIMILQRASSDKHNGIVNTITIQPLFTPNLVPNRSLQIDIKISLTINILLSFRRSGKRGRESFARVRFNIKRMTNDVDESAAKGRDDLIPAQLFV